MTGGACNTGAGYLDQTDAFSMGLIGGVAFGGPSGVGQPFRLFQPQHLDEGSLQIGLCLALRLAMGLIGGVAYGPAKSCSARLLLLLKPHIR